MKNPGWASVALPLFALFFSACSQTQIVKSASLTTSGTGTSAAINLGATLDLNGFQIGGLDVPIVNPTNNQTIGSVTAQVDSSGDDDVTVTIDIGELINQAGNVFLASSLPNGQPLPIAGSPIWEFSINTDSKVYVAALSNETVVGFAFVIPQLDSLNQFLSFPINFFPTIPINSDLNVTAGIFTGTVPSTSGVGMFAVLNQGIDITIPSVSGKLVSSELKVERGTYTLPAGNIQLVDQTPSNDDQYNLGRGIQHLKKHTRVLTVQ